MMRVSLVLALGLVCNLAVASDAQQADAEMGKAKSVVCAACHGADGNSSNPAWPKLAGQHPTYLAAQLHAFKSGARNNPLMMGQAAGLSDQDIDNLSAYYAQQTQKPGVADPALVEAGQALYRGGRAEDAIPACSACHGPQGLGNAAASYPKISGQHASYTAIQLKAYRSGERAGTDAAKMMSNVAAKMSDADIEALASFVSGLH
jgi:cytochrome c553